MTTDTPPAAPRAGAESALLALKANGIDGLFANAGTDFLPVIETGRAGRRLTPIHDRQAMFDQTAQVRESVTFDYEMRLREQVGVRVARFLAVIPTKARAALLDVRVAPSDAH